MDTQLTPQTPASTMSGHPLRPVYGPADAAAPDAPLPGTYPFTRGLHPEMYRTRLWTMRMFAGFGAPEDTNQRFRDLLAQGQTGLSTAFDMPALMGYDPDHAMSHGEVGREGVSTASADDFRRLYDGIDLDAVSVSMTISGPAPVALALYVAAAEERGFDRRNLSGTLQTDILKEYIAQQRVDRPRASGHAAGRRPDRVLRDRHAALAPRVGVRVPHSRGRRDRRPGARVHARRRRRVRGRDDGPRRSTRLVSARDSRSSSTATRTSSRRSRSCGPPADCGRG